jgi:hypothetical protein
MFKCKECGRGFSANIPDTCPGCGAVNHQPESLSNRRLLGLIFVGAIGDLVIFAILVGIIVAVAIKYL